MLSNFGLLSNIASNEVTPFAINEDGDWSITGSAAADQVEVVQSDAGSLELWVNNQRFLLRDDMQEVRFYARGDQRDRIVVPEGVHLNVVLDHSDAGDQMFRAKPVANGDESERKYPDALAGHAHDHDERLPHGIPVAGRSTLPTLRPR